MRVRDGAVVQGSNVSIRTTNDNGSNNASFGVWVQDGATVTLIDSRISAEAIGSSAVEVYDGTFIGTRVSLSATGHGEISSGVYVFGAKGLVSLTDSSVRSNAADAHAVYADDQATVSLVNTQVSASGDGAHGLHLENGGTIDATNVEVAVTGVGASALSLARDSLAGPGSITMKGADCRRPAVR